MKKLLITVAAYIAILLAPTAAKPATIVQTFEAPLPFSAPIFLDFGIQPLSTNIHDLTRLLARLTTCS